MSNSFSGRFTVPVILAVLVIALFTLAILQYRWTTQMGEVTGLRIGTDLKAMMMDWHLDFFRQLSDLPVGLQVGPEAGAHDTWKIFLQRYQVWTNIAVDASLVRDVYVWETGTSAQPRLLRFNLQKATLDPVAAPGDLDQLLGVLRSHSTNLTTAYRVAESLAASHSSETTPLPTAPPGAAVTSTGWQFDPSVPALAHSIHHHALPGSSARHQPHAVDWIVAVFDWDKIETELIPRLAERYFGNPEGLEFKVAVVSAVNGRPDQVLYASDPGFGISGGADATMNIFGPPPQNLESRVWQPRPRASSASSPNDWQNVSGLIWFPVIQYSGKKQVWELRVRHRRDSLASIIAGVRRRNLIVGLGVLSVLAGAIIMLLVASYRAQTLSRLQMQFVASVSHELRTPLAVLSSATENIADGIVRDPSRREQYRAIMRKQIRQLSEIVDHVLLFAATTQSAPSYNLRSVAVLPVVQLVVEDSLGFVEQNGINLECHVADDLPPVWGDPAVLSQCMQTLIVNAIKYGGENRWVGVEAKLGQAAGGQEMQITVRDRGIGIKGSELPHIFKPYRSPSVTAANIHGSGLGLSLAKRLVEAIGGQITVASELGKGSAFTLHLRTAPRAEVQPREAAPVAHA